MDELSEEQKAVLIEIRKMISEFYEDNDNDLTYALTGLITELTNLATGEYCDPVYLKEKLGIICEILEG